MSVLADRLRGIIAAVPAGAHRPAPASVGSASSQDRADGADAADVLGGQWIESDGQRVLVVDRLYRPGHRHGRFTLLDHVLPDRPEWLRVFLPQHAAVTRAERAEKPAGSRSLFVDLETTGLAGGAGTYAFLVGCAWFEECSLRVRQLFMSSAAVESAMLTTLAGLAAQADLVISFNGKSFDVPLIDTRYHFHRRESPFSALPHLDMLHPSRRLWRPDGEDAGERTAGGCSLGALEASVCGFTREGDVPGFEIPSRYFHFVRTGDAAPLESVFEHNRLDLVSLAFLTARGAQLVDEGMPTLATSREAVGLGQLFERSGEMSMARRCFARAAGIDGAPLLPGDEGTRAEAMHAYAVLCRRDRRHADAATAWRQLLNLHRCPPALARSASEALAVHHEHRLRDLATARAFAQRSASLTTTATRQQALQHRLARLERKLVAQPLWLF